MKRGYALQIGNFGGDVQIDGQTVKTRMVYKLLKEKYKHVKIVDIYNFSNFDYLFLMLKLPLLVIFSQNVFIGLGKRGMKTLAPIVLTLCFIFKKDSHYYVVGGWMLSYLEENSWLVPLYKRFKSILVELPSMANDSKVKFGLNNVFHLPNFRCFDSSLTEISSVKSPVKLVFFSRVIPEKGIHLALDVLERVNKDSIKATLDVYGPVFDKEILLSIESCTNSEYKGVLSPDEHNIYTQLSNYDLLLFPTFYEGEGYPGAIVDSFFSGLPVLASNWKYNNQIITPGFDGFLFEAKDIDSFEITLNNICSNPNHLFEMKKNALTSSEKFSLKNATEILDTVIL